MRSHFILASSSNIRQRLLRAAGVRARMECATIDEVAIRERLSADRIDPNNIAMKLAEAKARDVGHRFPGELVVGCDQVLVFKGDILGKANSQDELRGQLRALRGEQHQLHSAVVVHDRGRPIWHYVGVARLTMRDFSDAYLAGYLARNWPDLRNSVGGYHLEEEGARLMARVEGDYFTVLGLPLIELLGYLTMRGDLQA